MLFLDERVTLTSFSLKPFFGHHQILEFHHNFHNAQCSVLQYQLKLVLNTVLLTVLHVYELFFQLDGKYHVGGEL